MAEGCANAFMQLAGTRGAGHRAGRGDVRRPGGPRADGQSAGEAWRLKLERPCRPAGSPRGPRCFRVVRPQLAGPGPVGLGGPAGVVGVAPLVDGPPGHAPVVVAHHHGAQQVAAPGVGVGEVGAGAVAGAGRAALHPRPPSGDFAAERLPLGLVRSVWHARHQLCSLRANAQGWDHPRTSASRPPNHDVSS